MSTIETSTTWDQIVQLITAQGQASGLSQDQINAAIAIAKAEGGWSGNIGDGGTSFGVFQFHQGGMLDSFAAWLGTNMTSAGYIAVQQPNVAIQFALQPGGYLYNALQQGAAAGNTGADLAMYAEQFGQRAASWTIATVGSIWDQLFGGGKVQPQPSGGTGGGTTGTTTGTGTTAPTLQPVPKVTDLNSGIAAIAATIANIGTAITNAPSNAVKAVLAPLTATVRVAEQFLWIIVGLALCIVGLWLIVQAEQQKVLAGLVEGAASE